MKKSITRGYTLVELMVVIAIIGIVSAIAYPSYQGYVSDTYRTQAIGDLKVCAMGMERYYSNDFTYVLQSGMTLSDICPITSPAKGNAEFDLTLVGSPTSTDFLLQAQPVDSASCGGECIQLDEEGTIAEL